MTVDLSTLDAQNYFQTSLKSPITASDTVIPVNEVPAHQVGFLVISPKDAVKKEIILHTSVNAGAGTVTCPSVEEGRGIGETTAQSHEMGEPVTNNIVAEYFRMLATGQALRDTSVAMKKLNNPYKMSAYRSGNIQIPNPSVWTKVPLNVENYDPNNNFDSVTNFEYTVPVTGYYQVEGQVRMGGAKMITLARLATTDYVTVVEGQVCDNVSYTDNYSNVSDILYLTAGKKLILEVMHQYGGGAASLTGARLSIHLLNI